LVFNGKIRYSFIKMGFLDWLFPRKCVGCGKGGGYFCGQCLNTLSLISENICPECSQGSIDGRTHPRCKKKYSLEGLTSVFKFKGIIGGAISKLKYRFVWDLADDLVEGVLSFLGEARVFGDFVLKENPLLVPVPLFGGRKRWRGFNQAELLGKMVAKNLGIDYDDGLLLRTRQTKPQAMLQKKMRLENVRRAFALRTGRQISRKSLIVFDDVWTSGATMRECGKVLKRGGAGRVWGLTIAR
jgi:ComF family protein